MYDRVANPASTALLRLIAVVLAVATPASAGIKGPMPTDNPRALSIIEAAEHACAAEDAGDLIVEDGAYTQYDLDGDEDNDFVISFDHIFCQHNFTRWAGTGGTPKVFILDGESTLEVWGGTWQTVDVSPFPDEPSVTQRLILIPVHGITCDGSGAQPCWRVIAPFEGKFSTMPVGYK
ncbi:MAG: hypothetical protein AAF393_02710 [Pseudomonadota bacterium]